MTSGKSAGTPATTGRRVPRGSMGRSSRRHTYGWSSSNWCGIVSRGARGSVKEVSASWIVPEVGQTVVSNAAPNGASVAAPNGTANGTANGVKTRPSTYSAAWIGVDGYRNHDLIQVGTEQDSINGSSYYYAWWEVLPMVQKRIGKKVNPGDRVEAQLKQLRPGKWLIRMRNVTQKWTFETIQRYTGPGASAEWIMEAPLVGGRLSNIAQFKPIRFTRCMVNNRAPQWTGRSAGLMVRNGVILCAPSVVNPGTVIISTVRGKRLQKKARAEGGATLTVAIGAPLAYASKVWIRQDSSWMS